MILTTCETSLVKHLCNTQAFTFVVAAVPSVATWLFVRHIILHILRNRSYYDALFASTFYIRNALCFHQYLGWSGLLKMYLGLRVVQSIIFTWVSQISHIPRDIITDRPPSQNFNWVQMQLEGTLNVKGGYFNDWFTGHLNYQIEHHLWPTMPRHQYPKVAPMVRALCEKHNLEYCVLPHLFQGCVDVVQKLRQTAQNFTEYESARKQEQHGSNNWKTE